MSLITKLFGKEEERTNYATFEMWSSEEPVSRLVNDALREAGFLQSPFKHSLRTVYYGDGSEFRVRIVTKHYPYGPLLGEDSDSTWKEAHIELLADSEEAALTAYKTLNEKLKGKRYGAKITCCQAILQSSN